MSSYYTEQDPLLRSGVTTIQNRLMMELNHKQYYPDDEIYIYLEENGLNGDDIYNKDIHYKKLLRTVKEILEALSGNIDLFRTVETEFATTGAAYDFLERRIQRLQQRIDSIPDDPIEDGQSSDFTYLFKD
jgi:hypothetical protein